MNCDFVPEKHVYQGVTKRFDNVNFDDSNDATHTLCAIRIVELHRFIAELRLITTLSLLKPLPTFLEKSMRANRIALRFIESLSYKNIEFRER